MYLSHGSAALRGQLYSVRQPPGLRNENPLLLSASHRPNCVRSREVIGMATTRQIRGPHVSNDAFVHTQSRAAAPLRFHLREIVSTAMSCISPSRTSAGRRRTLEAAKQHATPVRAWLMFGSGCAYIRCASWRREHAPARRFASRGPCSDETRFSKPRDCMPTPHRANQH